MKLLTRQLLAQLGQVRIPSRRRLRERFRGEHAAVKKGSSLEFSDYREYLPGDDIRSIDWNVYARTEHLFLKLFLEEQMKHVYFVVDSSESMNFGEPTKFEYALAVAAGLSYACIQNYDHARILLVNGTAFRSIPFASASQFFLHTAQLENARTSGETKWNTALRKIALARLPRGVYFLLSDFYSADGLASGGSWDGMKILAAAGNELNCLQVLTDEEIAPSYRGDFRLLDSENESISEVSINPSVLGRYSGRLKQLQDSIKQAALHSMAAFYMIRTSTPLKHLLLQDLRKTGML